MPFCDRQRAIVFSPVEARGRTATSYALQDSSFTSGYCSVFQGPNEGRSFCDREGKKKINCKITSWATQVCTPWYLEVWSYNLNLNLSNKTQDSGNPASSALLWITAATAGTANIPKIMLARVWFMYSNSKFAYDHNVKSQCLQKIPHSRRNCPSITTQHSSCYLNLDWDRPLSSLLQRS